MHININEINLGRKSFANRLGQSYFTAKLLSLNPIWAGMCFLCVSHEKTTDLSAIK